MNKEYKSFPFEYKLDEEKGIFTGYASVFGNKDSHGDIVEKGAFKKTIKEFKTRIKVLFQHMSMMPIGKPNHLEEDSKGLLTETKVSMTTLGKDVWILLKDKVVTELSIGYDTIKKVIEEDGEERTRRLLELKLWEYSPVTWASNDLAAVTGTKSDEEIEGILFKLNDFMLKEGRVLSNKNKTLVKNAIEALQALINATEPGKSTPDLNEPPEDKDNKSDEHLLVSEIMGPLNDIASEIKGNKLVDELKEFGESLRKGD